MAGSVLGTGNTARRVPVSRIPDSQRKDNKEINVCRVSNGGKCHG